MDPATTNETTTNVLTQDEIFALAARAKVDGGALDELATSCVQLSRKARRAEFLERQVERLEHRLANLLDRFYGRSSEKIDPAQLLLFLQQEATAQESTPLDLERGVGTKPHRRGHGRGSFPAHVARKRVPLDPPEGDRKCDVCRKDLRRIREEIAERGSFIPGRWLVNAYVRGVWACGSGCTAPRMEPLPPGVVEKSRFEPDVAVHAAVAKYADHLPLERQSEIHGRLGVDVPPSTLGDAVVALAELHRPTVERMREEVVAEKAVHADDTPVVALIERALGDDGKKKERVETRVWVYRAATKPKMFFDFTESRSKNGPTTALEGFKGTLIADAAPSFNEACRRSGSKRAGCYAHVRRKFVEARGNDPPRAARALLLIHRLFRIESAAKSRRENDETFDDAALLALRRRRSARVVDKFFDLVDRMKTETFPQSVIADAAAYARNQRDALRVFLDDPTIPIHNNAAENALRCVAIGRKNYLFFGGASGGEAAAVFYSLIGTCRALGIDPYAYLIETTKELVANRDAPRERFTPWAWAEARLQAAPQASPAPVGS